MKHFYRKSYETLISHLYGTTDFTEVTVMRGQELNSFSSSLWYLTCFRAHSLL